MAKNYPDKFHARQQEQVEQDSTYEVGNDENNKTNNEKDGTLLAKNKPTIFHSQTKIKVDGKDSYEDTPDKMKATKEAKGGKILMRSNPDTFHSLQQVKVDERDSFEDSPQEKVAKGRTFHEESRAANPYSDDNYSEVDHYEDDLLVEDTNENNPNRLANSNRDKSIKPKRIVRIHSKINEEDDVSDLDRRLNSNELENGTDRLSFENFSTKNIREPEEKDTEANIEIEKDVSRVDEDIHKWNPDKLKTRYDETNYTNMSTPAEHDLYFHGRY